MRGALGNGGAYSASSSQRLIQATPAPASIARSAALLLDGRGKPFCSAVRVGPQHFLTAAHCVAQRSFQEGEEVFGSQVRPEFMDGQDLGYTHAMGSDWQAGTIVSVELAPSFVTLCSAAPGCKWRDLIARGAPDLAILTLDSVDASVAQAEVDSSALSDGETVTMAGYGCTDGSMDPGRFQLRYGVSSTLSLADARQGAGQVFPPVTDNPLYAYTRGVMFGGHASAHNTSLCLGDSGGPLYRGTLAPGGAERVVGINSGTLWNRPQVPKMPKVNFFARVDDASVTLWLGAQIGGIHLGTLFPHPIHAP